MTIIVSIPDAETTIAEMATVTDSAFIYEMIRDAAKLDSFVPGASEKGRLIAEANGDESPEFPVMRVEEGWSDNGRLWDAQELESIAEQFANEPVGHWGHIDPKNAGFEAPEPQTTWLGAVTKMEASQEKSRKGEIVKAIYVAGYNLPGAPIRRYIKSKAVRGASWWGPGREIPVPGKGVQVRNFKLLSFDWARKLSEGMPTSRLVAVTSEMKEDGVADKNLAQVSPSELKEENPNCYALIVGEATAESNKTIAEMQGKVDEGEAAKQKLARVNETLGIKVDDDPEPVLAEMLSRVGANAESLRDTELSRILDEKIPGDSDDAKARRQAIRGLLPLGEMLTKVRDSKAEDAPKLIGEMVDAAFDGNETIKYFVSEMTPPAIRRRDAVKTGAGDTSANPYMVEERALNG